MIRDQKNVYARIRATCIGAAIFLVVSCSRANVAMPSATVSTSTVMPRQSMNVLTPVPSQPVVTPTSFVATVVPAWPSFLRALFVILSDDQTRLLGAFEGESHLQVLYQFSELGRAQVTFYPADFPAISRDGMWVTVIENKEKGYSVISRIELAAHEAVTILEWPGPQFEATISPDGKRVAFLSAQGECPESRGYTQRYWCRNLHVYVMDYDGNNVKRLTAQAADRCFLTWSPNSIQIAYREMCNPAQSVETPPQIYVMTLESYNNVKQVTQITASGTSAVGASSTWSPDGEWLQWTAYRSGVSGVTRLSRLNAEGKVIAEVASGLNGTGVWSPDSRRLARITMNGQITIWDVESGKTTTTQIQGVQPDNAGPQKWLSDGKRLVFPGYRVDAQGKIGEKQWFVVNTDGTGLVAFKVP